MITRFAPSPTGPLHLGHAYSAILAHDMAKAAGGRFLLRIEDIDQTRCKTEWEAQIYDDLRWLGLVWETPVRRQSDHLPDYQTALHLLAAMGLTYPCSCNRRDIELAAGAPQEGVPAFGPDGRIYPGTCRPRPMAELTSADVIRLNMAKAARGWRGQFTETGPAHIGLHEVLADRLNRDVGDVILARRGMGAAYHLAVVLDDAAQGVSHVTRGDDLFEATFIHVVLLHLLQLQVPTYYHHSLIRDENGNRLAKRNDAKSIAKIRGDGASPQDIRRMVGLE